MTPQEKQHIRSVFADIRSQMSAYFSERQFQLTNAQIFTFLSFCPNALAIASDGKVDEKEIAALEAISRHINVNAMVSLDLQEIMSAAPEPDDCIVNEEFNMRAASELLYLCRNMSRYENNIISSVKSLLKFDLAPEQESSLTKNFGKMMDTIVANNRSLAKEHERQKLAEIKQRLGIA